MDPHLASIVDKGKAMSPTCIIDVSGIERRHVCELEGREVNVRNCVEVEAERAVIVRLCMILALHISQVSRKLVRQSRLFAELSWPRLGRPHRFVVSADGHVICGMRNEACGRWRLR